MPVYFLVRKYADAVWVTSEPDRGKFIGKRLSADKVVAVRGGVDVKTPSLIQVPENKKFDAVFIGRFHPQKGVLELIDIWKLVCAAKPNSKLAMIGVGELENEVKSKISKLGLEGNIVLFGFKDGYEKLRASRPTWQRSTPRSAYSWRGSPVAPPLSASTASAPSPSATRSRQTTPKWTSCSSCCSRGCCTAQ